MKLIVAPDGAARCIYSETINLRRLGNLTIERGSHVEPNDDGTWHVDLKPVDGPILGPFCNRSDALAAELQWLEAHWL